MMNAEPQWKKVLSDAEMVKRLDRPAGRIDVVLDTDTYNEIDDQFALSYMVRSREKLDVKAIYAAPFFNMHSTSPGDGMERSYQEILKVLTLLDAEELKKVTYRGSAEYLPSEEEPAVSDAAKDLAERAMCYSGENPLYVISIGAITNIASAILMNPEIIERMVVIWLGGHGLHWPDTREFNMVQDIAAARIIFGCGVPLVQLPCMGVVSEFAATGPELEYHLRGKNKLCEYLLEHTLEEVTLYDAGRAWSRVIWDVTAVAWLLDGDFMQDYLIHSPIPEYDGKYAFDDTRHFIRYVYHVNRDRLFADLFEKLQK
ncbi:nucleoside hydrolase [Acetatifactor aquisgranensis]|uniref:nucleoside hydrolase n=1 Tax=Acetatifactor aquisgranensis TaxID=2941233 RepID=UPI00203A3E29|nr:nucleoside hydrolase [Acetatifactor aquisgranensis]